MLLEILIAVLAIWLLLKIISLPVKLIWKLVLNTASGFLILVGVMMATGTLGKMLALLG